MKRYYYDLHTHSCLSPCADNDNTPNNIAGMAHLCGLDIVALTDHNTCKNCPAFFKAAERMGIVPVAGMELTTSEDIHVVCLFEELSDAMRFDEAIDGYRLKIKNRTDIFGEQLILDENDEVIGEDEHLLSNATMLSLTDVPSIVSEYNGVCFPAHIDREANGIIAILGTLPSEPDFNIVEMRDGDKIDEYKSLYPIGDRLILIDSDSHYLTDMKDGENFLTLGDEREDGEYVRGELFRLLREK